MVAKLEKCQLIFLEQKEDHNSSIDINGDVIKMPDTVKLLGFTIDSKLRFNEHVRIICRKTSNKVKAASRVVRCLEPQNMIWKQLPDQYKAAKTDNELKMKIII